MAKGADESPGLAKPRPGLPSGRPKGSRGLIEFRRLGMIPDAMSPLGDPMVAQGQALRVLGTRQRLSSSTLPPNASEHASARGGERGRLEEKGMWVGSLEIWQGDNNEVGRLPWDQTPRFFREPESLGPGESNHVQQDFRVDLWIETMDKCCLGQGVEVRIGGQRISPHRNANPLSQPVRERMIEASECCKGSRAEDDSHLLRQFQIAREMVPMREQGRESGRGLIEYPIHTRC